MENKVKISLPIIVEGRYDKSTLLSFLDATVITTDGFAVFNSKEKQMLIRKIAGEKGVILLTDSDGGGRQIRSFLSGMLEKEKIHHLYIPKIPGKERRKTVGGKAGLLGVEGMSRETLMKVLEPFVGDAEIDIGDPVTKADMYRDGLTGKEGSAEKRKKLCLLMGLPDDMTPNALLAAINLLYGKKKYEVLISEFDRDS